MKRTLPFALLASIVLPAFSADNPDPLDPYALTWPSGADSGEFTRAVAGQFDGDGIPDVVQIRGNQAAFFKSPAVFDTATVLGSGATV
jgi:hypothetical protein